MGLNHNKINCHFLSNVQLQNVKLTARSLGKIINMNKIRKGKLIRTLPPKITTHIQTWTWGYKPPKALQTHGKTSNI